MYTREQAAGVTWGALAAMFAVFRNENPLISFDLVKTLRLIRVFELQKCDLDRSALQEAAEDRESVNGVVLAKLKRELAGELRMDEQTAETRIDRLLDLSLIMEVPNPNRARSKLIVLTSDGRETLERIEDSFCRLFDLLIIQRDKRGEIESAREADYSSHEKALCDPFSERHNLPRPGH
ncbi:MAG: hypothetical protein AAGM38_06085 [Pseudomonadota bacterium]